MQDIILYIVCTCAMLLMLMIPLISTIILRVTYASCKKKKNKMGLTGRDVAEKIMNENGLVSIYIVETKGTMTDNYDPSRKVLRLSEEVYSGDSIASVAIAAHESGHAVQDAENFSWFKMRKSIYPVVSLGERLSYIVLIIGLLLHSLNFVYAAVILMLFGLTFEIVTLPVELNASKRGLQLLKDYNLIDNSDIPKAKKMLTTAAFTYIAAILTTISQMIYYATIDRRR